MSSAAIECPDACITPFGSLMLVWPAVAATTFPKENSSSKSAGVSVADTLVRKFANSVGNGLTFLASEKCDLKLSTSLAYWREFAHKYFRALCRQGVPAEEWLSPAAPKESLLCELHQIAPLMRGLQNSESVFTPDVSARNTDNRYLYRETERFLIDVLDLKSPYLPKTAVGDAIGTAATKAQHFIAQLSNRDECYVPPLDGWDIEQNDETKEKSELMVL